MTNINAEIKKIIADYIQNESLSDYAFATFSGESLKIDNKPIPIPKDMIVIPIEYEAELSFSITKEDINSDGKKILTSVPQLDSLSLNKVPVKIKPKYKSGDKVIVAIAKGGQKYTVIGRV